MTEKKIDLIAQLLSKAESTTPEEAEALREHAHRLMAKYMIDQAVIDARRAREGKSHEQIVTKVIPFEGMYRNDMISVGAGVAEALGTVRVLQSKGRLITHLHVIGFESDVEQADILIRSLQVQALLAVRDWWYSVRDGESYRYRQQADKVRARHTFIVGFGLGASERIRENRATVIEEAGSGTDLVLLDRRHKVDEFVDQMATGKARASRRRFDGRAAAAGTNAGRQANTGERAMDRGRGLPAGR
ncbi:hypothetical protein PBI_SMARTIES_11 [Microbacterium phage Smarties]|uniref:Uncharacterized protein n=1 Tax=Microbacterium phage Ariadne TaxID=2656546 RepID=A0A649VAR1_9CAUD|nr:hypothetical protein QDA10_gp011 [Microbacterium phage Ariadne]QGJ89416.1 hypothetical protein PBI_ARIADNE_11 [Microbacterium phage Ariadne]QGJ91403.1 hypothetical protein PBI_SMARTIES_11 [Microbacterium phage Smarties]